MAEPEALARRLFGGMSPWQALPFWADGGANSDHFFAALPSSVERLSISDLPFRQLPSWIRRHLGTRHADGLTVLLLSYDAGRNLETIADTARQDPCLPDVVIAHYPAYGVLTHGELAFHGSARARRTLDRWWQQRPLAETLAFPPTTMSSSVDADTYQRLIGELQRGINAGDFYEVNLSRRLEAQGFEPQWCLPLYLRLRRIAKPQYGALWAMAPSMWLASASPECLLRWDPVQRRAASYPIKGTRPRHQDPNTDKQLARELATSVKDRAEHVMIVDLVRNDLGRVAETGSVQVSELFQIHHLGAVHHMVSEVSATVAHPHDMVDALAALFPGGSVTGAPKIAAMNAIEASEQLRRGYYCGSLGIIDGHGRAAFNILIRTAVAADNRLFYSTGGAIVSDSDASDEWHETEVKASALRRALGRDGTGGDARRQRPGDAASTDEKGP